MQAIDRILAILDIVAAEGAVSPTDIAGQMDLPFSTVARLVREMSSAGLLDREAGGARDYVLGWKIFDLATTGRGGQDLAVVAIPAMTRLRDVTGETVSLHILRGHQRVCIAEVQSKRELRRVIPPGTIQRLVGTSGGEVLLAGADDAMRDNLLAPLDLSGPERAAVIKRINVVAADGYSVLRNKDLGVSALSVPVRRGDGVLAALTASGPGTRFWTTQARECVDEAIACAERITRTL